MWTQLGAVESRFIPSEMWQPLYHTLGSLVGCSNILEISYIRTSHRVYMGVYGLCLLSVSMAQPIDFHVRSMECFELNMFRMQPTVVETACEGFFVLM